MSSDENQQALAWQQIIKNRAFYNVRVQRGESWVDAACRTLDELIDQKEQAEKSLEDFSSEDKRVEALADAWDEGNRAARIMLPVNPPRYQTNPYRSGEG